MTAQERHQGSTATGALLSLTFQLAAFLVFAIAGGLSGSDLFAALCWAIVLGVLIYRKLEQLKKNNQSKTAQGLTLTTILGVALTIFFALVVISTLNDFLGHMG